MQFRTAHSNFPSLDAHVQSRSRRGGFLTSFIICILIYFTTQLWLPIQTVNANQEPSATQETTPPTTPPTPPRPVRPEGPEISFESLLWDLATRVESSYFPSPRYHLRQASSSDPVSVSSADASTWFSNSDAGHYRRAIEYPDRTEQVMLDVVGPGAVVRIFAEHPAGILRIYLDGSETPVIEEDAADFLSGRTFWKSPMNALTAQGWNAYVPIPFKDRCVITYDGAGAESMAYEVDYRIYPPDTPVISLDTEQITAHARLLGGLQRGLRSARSPKGADIESDRKVIMPGDAKVIFELNEAGTINELSLSVEVQGKNLATALRGLILRIEFDGTETVWCPVSDFFVAAPEVIEYSTWRTAIESGWLQARWFMPFQENTRVTLENNGTSAVRARYSIRYRTDYEWDPERSMYFHTNWTIAPRIPTQPAHDWNLIEITGAGVLVGDALVTTNPSRAWWGEGDPKIYVDHEEFPSTFGTGMDHYYGFGKHSSQPFVSPFHSRPFCEGPGSYGQSAANRFRGLDAIPFAEHLKFDFGIGHTDPSASLAYAGTIFWYGRAGATANLKPADPETLQAIPSVRPLEATFKLDDVLEGEELAVARTKPNFKVYPQHLWRENLFSQDFHLFGDARTVGAHAEIAIPISEPGRYHLTLRMTKGPSYGMVFFWVNGEETGIAVDLFNEANPYDIDPADIIDLGIWEVTAEDAEEIMLGIEAIGRNDASAYPYYQWGLDAVTLEKIDE